MQTFLAYPNVTASLIALDNKREGKQRVEAFQLINAIEKGTRWAAHPAAKMWKPYVDYLKFYYNVSLEIWVSRGFNNNMEFMDLDENCEIPWWLGDPDFHYTHRCNLVRKMTEHYIPLFGDLPKIDGYLWPENETQTFRDCRKCLT
jgi:hypothetical protein